MLNMWLVAYKNDTTNAYYIEANSRGYKSTTAWTKELTLQWQRIDNIISTRNYVMMERERDRDRDRKLIYIFLFALLAIKMLNTERKTSTTGNRKLKFVMVFYTPLFLWDIDHVEVVLNIISLLISFSQFCTTEAHDVSLYSLISSQINAKPAWMVNKWP